MKKATYLLFLALAAVVSSCSDNKSYSEMLTDENHAVNFFLSNCQVINDVPTDSVFVSVESLMAEYPTMKRTEAIAIAPYYKMDDDGSVYMQVISPGTGDRAVTDQLIYFRFNRSNLNYYYSSGEFTSEGNASDLGTDPTSFRFNNMTLQSSYQWGSGLQIPLKYLRLDCEVNVVIKSTMGLYDEQSSVIPYLYNVRYYPSRI